MSCPHCAQKIDAHLPHEKERAVIALVGNPNVGKSTLFNQMTGAKQQVVNAPGTTVEVMAGTWKDLGGRVLDLPGTYSLVAQSLDEQTVVDTLAGAAGSFTDPDSGESIDLVVCVLDAAALTRSLYLLAQVAKTGYPMVAVVTLADVASEEGKPLDIEALQAALGIPVMAVDPRTRKGIAGVKEFVAAGLAAQPRPQGIVPDALAPGYNPLATTGLVLEPPAEEAHSSDTDRAAEIFAWINDVETRMGKVSTAEKRLSRSDKIDRFLLHPITGIPVFLGVMWLLFMVAGTWLGPVQDFCENLFGSTEPGAFSLANGINALLDAVGYNPPWLHGLLIGGISMGLGVVASFIPLMFAIFLMISLLEDSGYMARAAFLGDRLMRKLGLDGRVILPLIMGFGCNLPSLAAARSIPNPKQRLVTILITPYTSCAARLTIYLMIARIFFPAHTGTVVFGLYMLSIAMVVLAALVLKPFLTKGQDKAPLMLVLPAYQTPKVLVTLKNTWVRSWSFVKGAGKIIVSMTVLVWFISAIPVGGGHSFADPEMPMGDSLYGMSAKALEPVFTPAGFGDWHMTGALMTGFVAKETVISSILVSYNLDQDDINNIEDGNEAGKLSELVKRSFDNAAGEAAPLGALSFLIFVLTYTPCLATVAEQKRQIGAKLTLGAVGVQLVTAWILSVGFFQIGRLFL